MKSRMSKTSEREAETFVPLISRLTGCFVLALALVLTTPIVGRSEEVGTSCADCPNYDGAFSIDNQTGVTIRYNYRWGNKHPWKSMSLRSGSHVTHRYPLGGDSNAKAPSPYVRFDNARGTTKEYLMHFYAIGYAGYGPGRANTEPKKYFFKYAGDGRLDLFSVQ